jgi:hypothetical protein
MTKFGTGARGPGGLQGLKLILKQPRGGLRPKGANHMPGAFQPATTTATKKRVIRRPRRRGQNSLGPAQRAAKRPIRTGA